MKKIQIICPKCGRKFNLSTQNVTKLLSLSFKCPKCTCITHFSELIGETDKEICQQQTPPNASNLNTPPQNYQDTSHLPKTEMCAMCGNQPLQSVDPTKTYIAGYKSESQKDLSANVSPAHTLSNAQETCSKAFLIVKSTGKKIAVGPGLHILGRDSSDSEATIRIHSDAFMSRKQARLLVSIRDNKIVAQLCPLQSRNAVYVNHQEVPIGAVVMLNNGDTLLLGMTEVTYIETN